MQSPRLVLFTLEEKIAGKLNRLERIGVLEEVKFSPIVLVLKPDGSVHICGVYRMTITPAHQEQD